MVISGKSRMKRFFAVFILIVCFSAPVRADATPTLISTSNDWKAYTFTDQGQKVCFISSQPKKQEGKFKKRGEVFFFVTYWANEDTKGVISISNGYTFKPDSQVTLKVDGRSYSLFTQGGMAWTRDQTTDDAVTAAIQKGSSMAVKGMSSRGTETTDTYSLKGSSGAYQAMARECGIKS
jgi:hypothetical protein